MKPRETSEHTILVEPYRKAATTGASSSGYKGLPIHALPGLHEFTAGFVKRYCKQGDILLDVAAGSGAMTLRLIDSGFNVVATDYVSENFRLHNSTPFFQADLNGRFSSNRELQFDAIVASEIIEHLENPRHFARECFRLLKPGGKIILSTPNVDCAASIVSFIRSGTFQWFGDVEYIEEGHISPLSQWQVTRCFTEAGFLLVENTSFGDQIGKLRGSPRLVLLSRLIKRMSSLPDHLHNQIFVGVFQKPF
jgi:SAM-dependent methyltransferase